MWVEKFQKKEGWKNIKIKIKWNQLFKKDERSQESSPKPSSNEKNTSSASSLKFIKNQRENCLPLRCPSWELSSSISIFLLDTFHRRPEFHLKFTWENKPNSLATWKPFESNPWSRWCPQKLSRPARPRVFASPSHYGLKSVLACRAESTLFCRTFLVNI